MLLKYFIVYIKATIFYGLPYQLQIKRLSKVEILKAESKGRDFQGNYGHW